MKRHKDNQNRIYVFLAMLLAVIIFILISSIEIKALSAGIFTEVNTILHLTEIKWGIMTATIYQIKMSL